MKRFFTLIAIISITLVAMAQRPLVTLSHDGELSFFSSLSALEDAISAATDGDIIYLSEGKFTSSSSQLDIDKKISIIGCGYKSHILADLKVDLSQNASDTIATPMFDGVRLQTLKFDNLANSRKHLKDVEIKKSWIRQLDNGGFGGDNLLIDRCYIETADFNGANNNNTYIQNSKIGEITQNNGTSIQIINCNIKAAYSCPRVVISSIIQENVSGTGLNTNGQHTIYNSLISAESLLNYAYVTTYDCYFDDGGTAGLLDENLNATIDLAEKGYLGEDGTVVGIYGGEFPFSETPSVPTVDSANSKVEFDAENNKLNVTITVAPN